MLERHLLNLEEMRRALQDWWEIGVEISEKGWRVLGIVGDHEYAQFLDMLGTCLATYHMSHFNVKSPLLGVVFCMLMKKKSRQQVTWQGVWGTVLDLSCAECFCSCGPWVSYVIPAGRLNLPWNFCHFLTSSASFSQEICCQRCKR